MNFWWNNDNYWNKLELQLKNLLETLKNSESLIDAKTQEQEKREASG